MRIVTVLPALSLLGFGAAAQAAATAPTPQTWYEVAVYVASVSAGCGDKVGSLAAGQLYLPSAGAAGSRLLIYSASTTGTSAPNINAFTLPATPTTNGGKTTGNFTEVGLPTNKLTKGTIALTFNWGDPYAFFITATTTVTGTKACTETYDLSAITTGR